MCVQEGGTERGSGWSRCVSMQETRRRGARDEVLPPQTTTTMLRPPLTTTTTAPRTNRPSSSSHFGASTTAPSRKRRRSLVAISWALGLAMGALVVWRTFVHLDQHDSQPRGDIPLNVLPNPERSPEIGVGGLVSAPLRATTPPPTVNYYQCGVIQSILAKAAGTDPGSEGLPTAGKQGAHGFVFWLKQPVKRARVSLGEDGIWREVEGEGGEDVILLRYNKYLPTQHTEKWSNTVSILTEFAPPRTRILPKLYGHCRDPGDGFHYILVEWIDKHPADLARPTRRDECLARAYRLLDVLEEMTRLGLALLDMKRGQWMVRGGGGESFVLQDVDDIVKLPNRGGGYSDQMEVAMNRVARSHSRYYTERFVQWYWRARLFPDGTFTDARYTTIMMYEMLDGDMGFTWGSRDCLQPSASRAEEADFRKCFKAVLDWTTTLSPDWPSPARVHEALEKCARKEEPSVFYDEERAESGVRSKILEEYLSGDETLRRVPFCTRGTETERGRSNSPRTVSRCGLSHEASSCCAANSNGDPCHYYVSDARKCGPDAPFVQY